MMPNVSRTLGLFKLLSYEYSHFMFDNLILFFFVLGFLLKSLLVKLTTASKVGGVSTIPVFGKQVFCYASQRYITN